MSHQKLTYTDCAVGMTIEEARGIGSDNADAAYDMRHEKDYGSLEDAAAAYAVNVIDSINEKVDTDDMRMRESDRLHLYRLRQAGLNAFDQGIIYYSQLQDHRFRN